MDVSINDLSTSNMDDSLLSSSYIPSPILIDVIDLTKSPSDSARPSRSHQRNISSSHNRTNDSNSHQRRPLSPIILGNTGITQTKNHKKGRKKSHPLETVILDDTIKEDNATGYTVELDNTSKQPIPLKCPICFELLTSSQKPMTTRCGHLFCTECLESFIARSKKCATCQTSITLKSCTRLYL